MKAIWIYKMQATRCRKHRLCYRLAICEVSSQSRDDSDQILPDHDSKRRTPILCVYTLPFYDLYPFLLFYPSLSIPIYTHPSIDASTPQRPSASKLPSPSPFCLCLLRLYVLPSSTTPSASPHVSSKAVH
jgi:hypothetical protein